MIKTEFYNDFLHYYSKASALQVANLTPNTKTSVNDPIMDSISIYDTINRKYAGFSKALEDIHGVRTRKDLVRYGDFSKRIDSTSFHFLHLFHRFTGSGASFQPTYLPDGTRNPKEHGYHNNHVSELASLIALRGEDGIACAREYITTCVRPMVTSTGNQPPSLKNPYPEKYRLAQQYYFDVIAEHFVKDYMTFLVNYEYENNKPAGIKDGVDFCCGWHKDRGFKQWKFVLTAFVMDTAEYYPQFIDPDSHCYYGANCIRGFDLMFSKEKTDPKNKAEFHELCMTELCKAVQGRPYDVEDCLCDYIRYLIEYIPKGYEHLSQNLRYNNSTLKISGKYPKPIQDRIQSVIYGKEQDLK